MSLNCSAGVFEQLKATFHENAENRCILQSVFYFGKTPGGRVLRVQELITIFHGLSKIENLMQKLRYGTSFFHLSD